MEFKKLEKQLLATAKAFRAFKTEFGYGKSGEELLRPFSVRSTKASARLKRNSIF